MAEFYERLSLLREEKGLNKTEMAKRLGIPVSTYSNYEYGNREPDFTLAKKIADYFNVTTDYLLGRDVKEENVPEIDKHAKLIAAHIDDNVSDEEMGKITSYIEFLKTQKKK